MQAFEVFGDIVLRGTDAAISGVDRVGNAAENLGKRVDRTGRRMQAFGDASMRAGRTLSMRVTAPLVAAGAAALGFASKVANTADEIQDLEAATGMSAQAIQEWRHVADMANVSQNAVTDASIRLSRQLGGATEMTESQTAAFSRLGLSAGRLKNMSADARMDTILTSLSQVRDATTRADIATEIFGRRVEDIAPIIGMTAREMARFRREGAEFALTSEQFDTAKEFRESMTSLRKEFAFVGQQLMLNLMPTLTEHLIPAIREHVIPLVESFAEGLTSLIETFAAAPAPIQKLILGAVGLAAALGPLLLIFGGATKLLGGLVIGLGKGVMALGGLGKAATATTVATQAATAQTARLGATAATSGGRAATMGRGFLAAARMIPGPIGIAALAITGLVAAGVAVVKNWDTIGPALGKAGSKAAEMLGSGLDAARGFVTNALERVDEATGGGVQRIHQTFARLGTGIRSTLSSLAGNIGSVMGSIASNMVSTISNAASNVISAFQNMYQTVVGNSIVPDMRTGVVGEFKGLEGETDKLSRDLSTDVVGNMRALERVPAGLESAGSQGGPGAAQTAGGAVNIDMRHAVLRDDDDLYRRIQRRGGGMLGGLA